MNKPEQIVRMILDNLRDRRGIRQAFEALDDDMLDDMITELTDLVEGVLNDY